MRSAGRSGRRKETSPHTTQRVAHCGGSDVAGRPIIGNSREHASSLLLHGGTGGAHLRECSAATRAYVMNGLFVGHGLAVIADQLRQRGDIVAYGSYEQNRQFAADACAHIDDRIIVIGHSFGAERAAEVATQAAACGARDVTMIGIDPSESTQVSGVAPCGEFRRRTRRHHCRRTEHSGARLQPHGHHRKSRRAGAHPAGSAVIIILSRGLIRIDLWVSVVIPRTSLGPCAGSVADLICAAIHTAAARAGRSQQASNVLSKTTASAVSQFAARHLSGRYCGCQLCPRPHRARGFLAAKPGADRRLKEVACSGLNPNSKSCREFENGKNSRSEDVAAADALADKIARLKELRLARDAAARAAPRPVPIKKVRDKKKQKKRPAVALANWLTIVVTPPRRARCRPALVIRTPLPRYWATIAGQWRPHCPFRALYPESPRIGPDDLLRHGGSEQTIKRMLP